MDKIIHFTVGDAALLSAIGYTKVFIPGCWEDVGGPESGPHVVGHPDMDIWSQGNHEIVVIDNKVVACEYAMPAPPGWEDQPDPDESEIKEEL